MDETDLDRRITAVRRFNRLYTQRIGVLDEGYLDTPFSLTESRVLYELAHDDGITATQICDKLGLDPGYLSRMLKVFQEHDLIDRRRAWNDGRHILLSLTETGRAAFAPLDAGAKAGVARMLEALTPPQREALTGAMDDILTLLDPGAGQHTVTMRGLRAGELGWIVTRHGALYAEEYGWGIQFEAMVSEICAALIRQFDPRREACWIADEDGRKMGSVAIVRDTDEVAQLRLLLVEPPARGRGLGRRLVEESVRFAGRVGYRRVKLVTYETLGAARRIYSAAGFRCIERHAEFSYGHNLVGETWELTL